MSDAMYLALVSDDLGTLVMSPDNGYLIEEFDPGWPTVRESYTDRPDAHGFTSDTAYFGVSTPSWSGKLKATATKSRSQLYQDLAKFLVPTFASKLRWQRDDDTPVLEKAIYPNQTSWELMAGADDFNVSVKADPFWSEYPAQQETVFLTSSVSLSGDGFPITFPWDWSEEGDLVYADCINTGASPVSPVITIYGNAPNAVITNETTGQLLRFTGYELPNDQALVIDMAAKTCIVDGTTSVFGYIDWALGSSFWDLAIGTNAISLRCGTAPTGNTPFALVTWQNPYL